MRLMSRAEFKKTKLVTYKAEPQEHAAISALARKYGVTVSTLIRESNSARVAEAIEAGDLTEADIALEAERRGTAESGDAKAHTEPDLEPGFMRCCVAHPSVPIPTTPYREK